jgi:hypothetical protein
MMPQIVRIPGVSNQNVWAVDDAWFETPVEPQKQTVDQEMKGLLSKGFAGLQELDEAIVNALDVHRRSNLRPSNELKYLAALVTNCRPFGYGLVLCNFPEVEQ